MVQMPTEKPKELEAKPITLPAQTMHELVEILARTNPKTIVEKVTFGVPSLHRNLIQSILDANKAYVEKQRKFDEVRKEYGERLTTITKDIEKLKEEKLAEETNELRKAEIEKEAKEEKDKISKEIDGELVKVLKETHEIEFIVASLVVMKDGEILLGGCGCIHLKPEERQKLHDSPTGEKHLESFRILLKDETPVTINPNRKSYLFLRSAVNENGRKFGIFLASKDEDALMEALQISVEE